MAPFLRKYGTLLVSGFTGIRIPIIKRGVTDYAVAADWTPAPGDVKISVDSGGSGNVTNLPVATAAGNAAFWEFILTAAELTCKQVIVTVSDSATKAVEDQAFIVETFGNANAMYQSDFSAPLATPTNITAGTVASVTNPVSIAAAQLFIKKNTALNNFPFLLRNSTDHITPKTGATVTATRSINGGAFADCTNAATELASGVYLINLAAADLNGTTITLQFAASGADTRFITLVTQA